MKNFIASSPVLDTYASQGSVEFSMLDYHGSIVKTEASVELSSVDESVSIFKEKLNTFNDSTIGQVAYRQVLTDAISQLRLGVAEKVVLSRTVFVPLDPSGIEKLLKHWRRKFSNALVFSVETDQGDQWVGATPEVLLQGRGNIYFIDALAGTIPFSGIESVESFGQKERDEQAYVCRYIESVLQSMKLEYSVGPLSVKPFGNICHLYNQIEVSLSDKEKLTELERRIHPTSAVVGQPLQKAKNIISDVEAHDREMYTGLLRFRFKDAYISYVTLRCAKVYENGLLFYVGGGITTDSKPEAEWRETEIKLKTLIDT